MNSNYDFILPFFTASDKLRPALSKIHLSKNGYVFATDSLMVIRVSYAYVEGMYNQVDKFPNIQSMYDNFLSETIEFAKIKTDDLIACLAQYKWNRRLETKDCEKCKGNGTIECKCCHHEADCEECNGDGYEITGYKKCSLLVHTESEQLIAIGSTNDNNVFAPTHMHTIAVCAKILGCDEIEYRYDPTTNYSLFSIAHADIIVMSRNKSDYSEVKKINAE